MSLLRLLVEHPSSSEDPLVHTLDGSLAKGEVLAAVEARAEEFHDRKGDLVPVVADGVEALIAMFACFRAGAVYVPINPRQPQAAIDGVARALPEGGHRICRSYAHAL